MRSAPPPPTPSELALNNQCPRCQGFNIEKPVFTWWGGALGPKLFKHRVCRQCRFGFNGETGLSNENKVIAYAVGGVILGLIVGIGGLFFMVG